jgi:hypothetical protein
VIVAISPFVGWLFLIGVDISDQEGPDKLFTMRTERVNVEYPERLKITVHVNRDRLLEKYSKYKLKWVYSDVTAWDKQEEKPRFLFSFPLNFREIKEGEMQGWFVTDFEVSEDFIKHREISLYCVSRNSSVSLNAHIKLKPPEGEPLEKPQE